MANPLLHGLDSAAMYLLHGLGGGTAATGGLPVNPTFIEAMVQVAGQRRITVMQNDEPPPTPLSIVQVPTGQPVPLNASGLTGVLISLHADTGIESVLWTRQGTIADATNGVVDVTWQASDFATPGDYTLRATIQYGTAYTETTVVPLIIQVIAAPV